MPSLLKLSDLAVGSSATVREIPASSSLVRLREMGLLAGTVITLVRTAPLGDPLELKVRGYHLSVRKADAAHILVEAVAP